MLVVKSAGLTRLMEEYYNNKNKLYKRNKGGNREYNKGDGNAWIERLNPQCGIYMWRIRKREMGSVIHALMENKHTESETETPRGRMKQTNSMVREISNMCNRD